MQHLVNISSARAKEARWRAGLTVDKSAELLCLSSRQVHRYESGYTPLTVCTIDQMAEAYGVTWGWFFRVR